MQSMQIREGGGAYLGGPSLSGACQRSSCCLWWCHKSPAFSSPPRNTGRKNFSRCFKQKKKFPVAVCHRRTHLVGFNALHGQMVAVHPQSVPEDAQTVLLLLLKHLTDTRGFTCCLSFVITCVICVETAVSESLRYRKYLSVKIAWIPHDVRFTSHVLMCVASHSWRMESSCSMLDIYCFSRGKNSIKSDLTAQMYLQPYMSHNFQFVFFLTPHGSDCYFWIPHWKQEVNAKASTSKPLQVNHRGRAYSLSLPASTAASLHCLDLFVI